MGCAVKLAEKSHSCANATYQPAHKPRQASTLGTKSFGVIRPKLNLIDTHKHDVWRGVNKACDEKHTFSVEHGGAALMRFECVSYRGTGTLVRTDGKMNAACFQKILGGQLAFIRPEDAHGTHFDFPHDNDPKHNASGPSSGHSRKERITVS